MDTREKVDISQHSYVLTINEDRYNYQQKVFDHYGIPKPIKYKGLNKEPNGSLGCLIGHMSLVMMARCLDWPHIVIFEDDAYPRKDIVEKLDFYLSNIPANCGILCLGENGYRGVLEKTDNYFIIKERPYGSHAYIVFKESYDEYINSLERQRIVDLSLKGNNFYRFKPYWTNELLFVQKNIDNSCMSSNFTKSSSVSRFFVPHPQTGDLSFTNKAPDGFEDKIDGLKEKCSIFVEHFSWKGNCLFDEDGLTLSHGRDKSNLEKINDNVWKINWERYPNANEFLVCENEKYKIVKNYKA